MINNENTRAGYGEITIKHRGRNITTSVGSRKYESLFTDSSDDSYTFGNIPSGYANRPDLISNLFMNSPELWWVVCEQNIIFDVFEQLNSGDSIKLPPL